ncbi:MAG: hypothetical protein ACI4X9_07205 [Kiritimatiellia bacterium]
MDQNLVRADLLPATIPLFALVLMVCISLGAYILAHLYFNRAGAKWSWKVKLAVGTSAGVVFSWCVMQLAGRFLFLAGPSSLVGTSILCGAVIEGILQLYRHERQIVSPRLAWGLVVLRQAAVIFLLFILLQPMYVTERIRPIRRRVAVLFDESSSMGVPDKQWRLQERLDMALALGLLSRSELPCRHLSKDASLGYRTFAQWYQYAQTQEVPLETNEMLKAVADCRAWAVRMTNGLAKAMACSINDQTRRQREACNHASRILREQVLPGLGHLARAAGEQMELGQSLLALRDNLTQLAGAAALAESSAVELFWASLPEERREGLMAATEVRRATLAKAVATRTNETAGASLLDALRKTYDVDLFRFANTIKPLDSLDEYASRFAEEGQQTNEFFSASELAFRSETDMTHSLEEVLNQVPIEELAGVLMLTDGRHTGESGASAVARRYGQAGIPVSTLVVGGTKAPMDIALASVRAPESVFLGDKVRVNAIVHATQAKGQKTVIRLLAGEKEIASEEVAFDSDDFVKEIRLTDEPEVQGVNHYTILLDTIEGEKYIANNRWDINVSVSDDRTNVLLVDKTPRWEYRYLRNLFYGRDKSVHLQFVLFEPDTIRDQQKAKPVAASASRKFGDAEAHALPVSRDEWRKFDVIILGDVGEDVLTDKVVENIRYCVEERGALLVVIAGPERMPFSIRKKSFGQLLPILYRANSEPHRRPPEEAYRFTLTAAGRAHDVLRLSSSTYENEQIWKDMPDFHWRIQPAGIAPGAEVLAYAEPIESTKTETAANQTYADDPTAAIRHLDALKEREARNALIVARSQGRGKVLMLNTDRTWRFRYRTGDTHHHRFWGQILRWGIGEKLRSGNSFVRLGTDRLSYTPYEPIRVLARLADHSFAPITDASASVTLLSPDGKKMRKVSLEFRLDSNGIYEAEMEPLSQPGTYTLEFNCPAAERLLAQHYPVGLKTQFIVVAARRPAEFVDVTASAELPAMLAECSGGRVVEPGDALDLANAFGEGRRTLVDRVEFSLWNSWLFFFVFVGLLSGEWILRKRAGLA